MYKVVLVHPEGTLGSVCMDNRWLEMTYVPGNWTAPRKYGPFVFDDLESAEVFAGYYEDPESLQIWECETAADVHEITCLPNLDAILGAFPEDAEKMMDEAQEFQDSDGDWDKEPVTCDYFDDCMYPHAFIATSIKLTRRLEEAV